MYKTVYCKNPEKIENYEKALKDNFVGWVIHHRMETHNSDGEKRQVEISMKELIALKMYYNRPAEELIFMLKSEHTSLHHKGQKAWIKGKKHSEETKRKMSESMKGKLKGSKWFNNGIINIRAKECPESFVPGRLVLLLHKISNIN